MTYDEIYRAFHQIARAAAYAMLQAELEQAVVRFYVRSATIEIVGKLVVGGIKIFPPKGTVYRDAI
jgi:hypothetical protein